MTLLDTNDAVFHREYGEGTVLAPSDGVTAVVRFDGGIQQCPVGDLVRRRSVSDRLAAASGDDPDRVIARVQAEAIRSVNQQWGIFAPSRIKLLPHQLWVCKKVLERSPARWLVADDVGLGKTIEAGLILWPLVARGKVNRLLILAPASLTEQWQERMRRMFDLRMRVYRPEDDTEKSDYWGGSHATIASLQTLRAMTTDTHKARRERLLEAPPWDLVIVDEAHHLNLEERNETLGYGLLRSMQDAGCIESMLFFTATPHRGKNFGFFGLLSLLRPELFDPKKPVDVQLSHLPEVMIRNMKSRVTDLRGNRIFQRPRVSVRDFSYTPEEDAFYRLLTEFIVGGRAYASTLSSANGQAVNLVLIALQKLAASSVAAVRAALRRRVATLTQELEAGRRALAEKSVLAASRAVEADGTEDDEAAYDERLWSDPLRFQLLENELPALQELLEAAEEVERESKVTLVEALLDGELEGRSVLMFTEYKATQALIVSMLRERFGRDEVAFINGDHALLLPDGEKLSMNRPDAADAFNAGAVRFLVSTEAAGEGVDLQESCHTLIHFDVPWNPMRIHQRNGRLVRYGQEHVVDILTLRNPDTVEARIWELLENKMKAIERALDEVTDDPEDLMEIVLGMSPRKEIEQVFHGAVGKSRERLSEYFDAHQGTLGGKDAIDAVRSIFGSVKGFDFQEASDRVPKADLPDLEPFMRRSMRLLGRRFTEEGGLLSIKRPEGWRGVPGIKATYKGLSFRRDAPRSATVLSCGHRLVLEAIEWAGKLDDAVARVGELYAPIVVLKVRDQDTTSGAQVQAVTCGVTIDPTTGEPVDLLRDWELLRTLEKVTAPADGNRSVGAAMTQAAEQAPAFVVSNIARLDAPFKVPRAEVLATFWPHKALEA